MYSVARQKSRLHSEGWESVGLKWTEARVRDRGRWGAAVALFTKAFPGWHWQGQQDDNSAAERRDGDDRSRANAEHQRHWKAIGTAQDGSRNDLRGKKPAGNEGKGHISEPVAKDTKDLSRPCTRNTVLTTGNQTATYRIKEELIIRNKILYKKPSAQWMLQQRSVRNQVL